MCVRVDATPILFIYEIVYVDGGLLCVCVRVVCVCVCVCVCLCVWVGDASGFVCCGCGGSM